MHLDSMSQMITSINGITFIVGVQRRIPNIPIPKMIMIHWSIIIVQLTMKLSKLEKF
jgi:hypothetical protein